MGQKSRSNFQVKMILMTENCRTQMKDVVSISFHVALLSPSLSCSFCLTLMVRYKMWPVAVHLDTEKKKYVSYASNFIWMTLLPSQGLALSPSISFSHFFISQFQSFIFTIRIAPTQGRPAIPHCSCAQNYHNSYSPPLPDSFQDERCRK